MAHIQIPDTAPRVQYSVGASPDSDFTIPFAYFQDADIVVYDGETKQTITTHYTIAGTAVDEGFSGGTVNLVTAVTNTTITIYRDVSVTRSTDFPTNGQFDITQLNTELDKMTAQIQQVEYDVQNRCIRFGQFTTGIPISEFTENAITRANKVISFDANGDPLITQELGTYKGTDATITTAAYVERDIVKSTTAAQLNNIYICTAASPIGTLLTNTSYWALIVDAVSAASSATSAASSATAAASSATAAAASETAAGTSATNSASSATNSASSATAAAASATAAAASADSFDDTYLGAKASDPTVDNDGDALTEGDMYFNSGTDRMRVYSGSAWANVALDSATVVSKTSATGSAELPSGTTAQRDGTPSAGYLRWNTTDTSAEVYDGSAWAAVGGGNSTTEGLYEHSNTISSNYTIGTGNNAVSAGDITINSGVTVTVPSGSNWVIV